MKFLNNNLALVTKVHTHLSLEKPRIQKWPQNLSHSTHKIDFGTNITKKNFNNIDSNAWRSTTNMKCLKFAESENLMQRWHWSNIQNTTMAHFKAFFMPHNHFAYWKGLWAFVCLHSRYTWLQIVNMVLHCGHVLCYKSGTRWTTDMYNTLF